jgi:hypothetical protein
MASTMNVRGALSNKIISILDTSVNNAFERVIHSFLKKNNAIHGNKYLCFSYNKQFFPSTGLTRTQQRNFSHSLDSSLCEDFENHYKFFVQDYQDFRTKMRHYVARIFRHARSKEELMQLLPEGLHPAFEFLDFVPLASAKGISDQERDELTEYYESTLKNINKFLMVKVLI